MAGKPGRSGGKRPGAGAKPIEPACVEMKDPLEFLLAVMQGKVKANPTQLKAAQAAAQYFHSRKTEGGKKTAKGEAAKEAVQGRFAPSSGPRLASVNGRKVAGAA